MEKSGLSFFLPYLENSEKKGNPKILVRVDDFPHWKRKDKRFYKFHEMCEKYDVPYLLGVTPQISNNSSNPNCKSYSKITKEQASFLKNKVDEGKIVLAFHGLTHQTINSNYHTEFIGLNEEQTENKIKKGLQILKKFNLKTDIIIPPFNTFDAVNLRIFKKYFKIVCGGSETIKTFDKLPIKNLNGIFYIPSYPPYYLNRKFPFFPKPKKNVCLTIHWAWFDLKTIEKILKKIKKYVINWDNLIEIL